MPAPSKEEIKAIIARNDFDEVAQLFSDARSYEGADLVNFNARLGELVAEDKDVFDREFLGESGFNIFLLTAIYGNPSTISAVVPHVKNKQHCNRASKNALELAFLGNKASFRHLCSALGRDEVKRISAQTQDSESIPSLLSRFIDIEEIDCARILLEEGADPSLASGIFKSPLEALAIRLESLEDSDPKKSSFSDLFRLMIAKIEGVDVAEIGDEKAKKFQKFFVARSLLSLSYSTKGYPYSPCDNLPKNWLEFIGSDGFLDRFLFYCRSLPSFEDEGHARRRFELVATIIQRLSRAFSDKKDPSFETSTPLRKINVVQSSIDEHASYFLVTMDSEGRVEYIDYIDGNGLISSRTKAVEPIFAVTRFWVDKTKPFSADLALVKNYLGRITDTEELRDKIMSAFCNKASLPEVFEVVTSQTRDNCADKSLRLLIRRLVVGIDNEEDLSRDVADVMKAFKYALIEACHEHVSEVVASEERGSFLSQSAKSTLEMVQENAERKLASASSVVGMSAPKSAKSALATRLLTPLAVEVSA